MNVRITALFASILLVCAACQRHETSRVTASHASKKGAAGVQDLANADAKLKVIPERPFFVHGVELSADGKNFAEGATAELKKSDVLIATVRMNDYPEGLMIRYEVIPDKPGEKDKVNPAVPAVSPAAIAEERAAPDRKAMAAVFRIPVAKWKPGPYLLKVWAGGDDVFTGKLIRLK